MIVKNPIIKKIIARYRHCKYLAPLKTPFELALFKADRTEVNTMTDHEGKRIYILDYSNVCFSEIVATPDEYVKLYFNEKEIKQGDILRLATDDLIKVENTNIIQNYRVIIGA